MTAPGRTHMSLTARLLPLALFGIALTVAILAWHFVARWVT